MKLPDAFYQRDDVLTISRELLGKFLFTRVNGELTGGMIVETEAYRGTEDRASHAWNGRLTSRTRIMYEAGGVAYVYLCYGIHNLFNVVTAAAGVPHAVLIRAIEPTEGIDVQLERRKMTVLHPRITAGPGALSRALGITRELNGMHLGSDSVWIEERGMVIENKAIVTGPRVGVSYAGAHALFPWRFSIRNNKFVSKAK